MKKKKINSNNLLLLITIVLFFVMYAAGCIVYADKGFTRFQTFLNILINNAGLICITAGMTCVMLTGGIDISVGSVVAMDCMILAVGIEQWGWTSPVLMLFILAIGIVFGVVQGFCISYLEIQPFIVTMAGMFFARGMTAVICKEQVSIVSDKIFTTLSSYKISLPFGGYLNKKGIMQYPYLRVTVVVALIFSHVYQGGKKRGLWLYNLYWEVRGAGKQNTSMSVWCGRQGNIRRKIIW